MTSVAMFTQSPSMGFKWEIGCTGTVPKNSNKSDVRAEKISPLARKVLEVPTSLRNKLQHNWGRPAL